MLILTAFEFVDKIFPFPLQTLGTISCYRSSQHAILTHLVKLKNLTSEILIFRPLLYNLLCTPTKSFFMLDRVACGRVKLLIICPGAFVFITHSEYLVHTWWYCSYVQNSLCQRSSPNYVSNFKRRILLSSKIERFVITVNR